MTKEKALTILGSMARANVYNTATSVEERDKELSLIKDCLKILRTE